MDSQNSCLLSDRHWQPRYDSDVDNLVKDFYEPALLCAIRYDRVSGYFSPAILTLVSRGIEGLIRNQGKMRLIVGCTLDEPEVEAIAAGEKLKQILATKLATPLEPQTPNEANALELLSWLIAHDYLEIKLAVPCTPDYRPLANQTIFHPKAGVIEDKAGNRLAFNGSNNETVQGWTGNWESFHVFTDWQGSSVHVDSEEKTFAELWAGRARRCLVVDIPTAVQENLLRFLPQNEQLPQRLILLDQPIPPLHDPQGQGKLLPVPKADSPPEAEEIYDPQALFKQVWATIQYGPAVAGSGDRIGEVTSAIKPYPHQIKAFQRLYNSWPPKLLIADEVGLGKTIQAGLLIRQAWLAGKAKRILIMAPKAVLKQWQLELREKFNLNIPIYDGKTLTWCDSPAMAALDKPIQKPVSRQDWHKEPLVITSSHVMRRADRRLELTQDADPFDLIILDEAHHARRRGVSGNQPKGANKLLNLMQELKARTQGLVLLTATPMQVSPIEVWDLLNLLGLPPEWDLQSFQRFFDYASHDNPSHAQFEYMARLFRAVEQHFGETPLESFRQYFPKVGNLALKKVLRALQDEAQAPRKSLNADRRRMAIALMKRNTPIQRLISRHTRTLLRKYYEAGKISSRIAQRHVKDEFVTLSPAERELYEAIENYISTTYNNASQSEQNAVGFVMTIYRRRLASSFAALAHTMQQRLDKLDEKRPSQLELNLEDLDDDEVSEEPIDEDEAQQLEQEALKNEERYDLESLLKQIKQLPTDTKAKELRQYIQRLHRKGYPQIIIFTQYTDTMDFLRQSLTQADPAGRIICFSGRGGERRNGDRWESISREETKRIFRAGQAEILLCTDAAAEGLNFQFCGALINYDMPWNPMRVEQRIGRIDRLGQSFADKGISIVNLHYADTVETDVYIALRERIGLFTQYVGRLQPILSTLSQRITSIVLSSQEERENNKNEILDQLEIETNRRDAFDIDEVTEADLEEALLVTPLYDLEDIDRLLNRTDLLPPGIEVQVMQDKEYRYSQAGMQYGLRVTTDPEYYDLHSSSIELWSPGNILFPIVEVPEGSKPKQLKL
jgi:SNF2 family DNA or RNA helicase